jgi:hypothetical protein
MGEKVSDLIVIEEIFSNFEDISGAILSRTEKSKVMGLGAWKGRQDWPLGWLKVVNMMKIFGFQVTPSYKLSLQMSWDACLAGFRKTIMSWKSRQLNTLIQRVEVLRVFATSKLWYKASALPLPRKFAKSFESLMGSFLWLGKLERLQIDEVKNPLCDGGLGLPCVSSKSDSLFLKQTCRLLMDSGSSQYNHVRYWLGLHLRDYFPNMAIRVSHLLKILQTFLSKKYVIPICEMFSFLSFQSFPASSRVSPTTAKNTKDFQNL